MVFRPHQPAFAEFRFQLGGGPLDGPALSDGAVYDAAGIGEQVEAGHTGDGEGLGVGLGVDLAPIV